MDRYRLDSQKLIYHPKRVIDWLDGKNIYPLFIEVAPAARCQCRCTFCAFDYLREKDGALLSETYCKILIEYAAQMGVKAILYAGEGEPLLNPSIIEMISYTKMHNIDVSLTTNGLKFDEGRDLNSLPFLSWLRFSVDAATPKTYAKVHGCRPGNFNKLAQNICRAVMLKKELHSDCTIGVQAVLIPQNQAEIVELARLSREWGVDYFTVKPFSKHPSSICNYNVEYENIMGMEEELNSLASEDFDIIFRANAMGKFGRERTYKKCLGLPFATYVAADGYVYACSAFLGDKDFAYGNLYEECFPAIWEGKRRQQVLQMMAEMGVAGCREACHLDEINRYLWGVKHPETVQHINFI